MRTRSLLVIGFITASIHTSWAMDAGKVGPSYTIREPDFLEDVKRTVQSKVDSGEWARLQADMRRRATNGLMNPTPVEGISTATAKRSWLFDPSIVLSRDLRNANGGLIFPAGTRINPLDVVSLPQPMLFIDARDARQVDAARSVMNRYDGSVTTVLVAGSWAKLSKSWKRQVFYDQEGKLVKQLGIRAVPAIVTQESTALRIEEFKP